MKDAQQLRKRGEYYSDQLIEWRRHFHRNPELSFQEHETAKFVAHQLNKLSGIKVKTGVGYPTTVIGELSMGDGPVIAVRADMDALPIQEENACRYRSRNEGVMHACGHDAHTTILLGAAILLSELFEEKQLKGTVKFLFQPAEERVDEDGYSGAAYMVEAGVLSGVDAILALHMSPEDLFGEAKLYDGYAMASVDVFKGKVQCTGGHGAYPHLGTDPIWIGNQIMQAIYGITSRMMSPIEAGVISIGKVEAGEVSNIIPSQLKIEGTVRSFSPKVRERLLKEVDHAFSIAKNLHADYQLQLIQEDPPLYNDNNINQLFHKSIKQVYPSFKIKNTPFGLAGEDFAHMTNEIPGAMIFLGCNHSVSKKGHLHTPTFDIDERVLPLGATLLANTVKNFLMR